jgi:hypothetical protein
MRPLPYVSPQAASELLRAALRWLDNWTLDRLNPPRRG